MAPLFAFKGAIPHPSPVHGRPEMGHGNDASPVLPVMACVSRNMSLCLHVKQTPGVENAAAASWV